MHHGRALISELSGTNRQIPESLPNTNHPFCRHLLVLILYIGINPSPFADYLWQIQPYAFWAASTKWEYTFENECTLSNQYLFGLAVAIGCKCS